jgi:Phosphotransferase enzyme family
MSHEAIRGELQALGFEVHAIVLSKADGTTAVAHAERDGEKLAVKWVTPGAPLRLRQELEREQTFYASAANLRSVPQYRGELRSPRGRGIALQFVEGRTLREWLAAYTAQTAPDLAQFQRVIQNVYLALTQLYTHPCDDVALRAPAGRNAAGVFSALLKSGPVQRQATRNEQRLNAGLRALGRPLEWLALREAADSLLEGRTLIHGDLHWNNVIVGAEERITLIDFGTVGIGNAALDCAYLTALLQAALAAHGAEARSTEAAALDLLRQLGGAEDTFGRLLAALRLGAGLNSRWRLDPSQAPLTYRGLYLPRLARQAWLEVSASTRTKN